LKAPLLTIAAEAGMLQVVKALLEHDVNLIAWDADGHLAVCRAVNRCLVAVVNVLLEAHAKQGGGDEGVQAVLKCPCWEDEDEKERSPLLFHAIEDEVAITDEAR
jgi:hypothetical protein